MQKGNVLQLVLRAFWLFVLGIVIHNRLREAVELDISRGDTMYMEPNEDGAYYRYELSPRLVKRLKDIIFEVPGAVENMQGLIIRISKVPVDFNDSRMLGPRPTSLN